MKTSNESDSPNNFIKYFLAKVYALKYYYIACIIVLTAAAYFYNKVTPKIYEINSVIGPVRNNATSLLGSNEMFRGIGTYNSGRNIEDAINNLNSFTLISKSVSSLSLEVGYFAEKNNFLKQTTEIYHNSPFTIFIDQSHLQPIGVKFYVTILSDSTFRLSGYNKKASLYNYIDKQIIRENLIFKIDTICKFNKAINNRFLKFSVSPNKSFQPDPKSPDNLYYFRLNHIEELAKSYLESLKIEPVSILASIIKVQFSGANIEKSLNFLNNYVNSFLEDNLAKKNKIAINTINFIDSQISEISDSLVISESKLRNFRSANQVMDLSFQGQRIYEQMAQIETDRANLEVQIRYYNYVINYFKTNQDMSAVVPPMSANITDPIMNQLITDLIALNAEKSSIPNKSEKNIFLVQIDNKIKSQKQAIIENVKNNLNTLNLSLNELNYRSEKLSSEISNLPRTEMNMVNMQRKFNLNDAIYTYLLQKRSEAAISLASNYPDYEILEPAREITAKNIAPKIMMNYILAVLLGLFLPTLFIIVRDFFSDKISSIYDAEHLANQSVLGVIFSNNKKYVSVVADSPSSAIAESFRNLRSNLLNRLKLQKSKVILVTSSQPQDGKSFISFNLAASIASVGFKTIIIDCDLRRPSIHTKFGIENTSGISTYMNRDSSLEEIIRETNVKDLSFIPAGPLLPNPSELLDAGRLDDLVDGLVKEYDYVLIDTSPIGLVADATQLMKYASQILLVARNNYTEKTIFSNAMNALSTNKITNYSIVINDVSIKKSPYSSYTRYYIKS